MMMQPLRKDEVDPIRLWAEIHRLRAAVQGPEGYASWQDAAVHERQLRLEAQRLLRALSGGEVTG
jgi:hypothetical protein